MRSGQKSFTTIFIYISYWLSLGVLYLLVTGIMQLINIALHFGQNQWLVGFIVLTIIMTHSQAKNLAIEAIKKMEEEEK